MKGQTARKSMDDAKKKPSGEFDQADTFGESIKLQTSVGYPGEMGIQDNLYENPLQSGGF